MMNIGRISRRFVAGFVLVVLLLVDRPVFAAAKKIRLLILGDSLTAGYGVERSAAYPSLVQELAKEAGYDVEILNGGMSGDTSAGGARRLNWLLRQPVDIFMLALGANDGLRGLDPAAMESNLREIIAKVREKEPQAEIVLAGMEVPPSLGERYTSQFREVFPRVAEATHVRFVPFLLEGVAGEPRLNQPDRIHPNEEGHKIIARRVWQALEPIVKKLQDGAVN